MGLLDRFRRSPRQRFAREVLGIARRLPGISHAELDPERFAIRLFRPGEREPAWLNLGNIFQETQHDPAPLRRDRVTTMIRVMTTRHEPESWERIRPRLRPVLRPQTFLQGGPPGTKPALSRPALPLLHELVVVDRPDAREYVTAARLTEWEVAADEVFAAARANLADLAERTLDRDWPPGDTIINMVDNGDAYVTSLPLAPGWLAAVGERMGTPVLAFLPDVNTLILTPVLDDLTALYRTVEEHFEQATRGLSPVGYRTGEQGRVQPYAAPAGHPHEAATRRAEAVLATVEYGAQTEWLRALYAEAGIDVHVAELLALVPPDGPAQTMATWAQGVTTLLPEVRLIGFTGDGGGEPFRVRWPVVAEHVPLVPEPLLAPARYRVEGRLPAATLARLRELRFD